MNDDNQITCVTLVLAPGESLANALDNDTTRDWMYEIKEFTLVAEGLGDDPLRDCTVLRDRVMRGDLVLTLRSYEEQDVIEADQFVERVGAKRYAELEVRDRTARSRPPHPDAESLQSPPMNGGILLENFEKQGQPAPKFPVPTKPTGPLAPYLGAQYEVEALIGETTEPEEAACMLAWPVPVLVGSVIVAADANDLAGAIRAVLVEVLGDLPFAVDSHSYGGLGKYMHLHTSVVAPPMGGNPMAIELYGRLIAAGDYDFSTREAGRFLLLRERSLQSIDYGDQPDADAYQRMDDHASGRDLPGPLVAVIESATYANVLYPGPGVPFYM